MGKIRGKGRAEGCLDREVVVVSSRGHTPDHRSCHKDITLFALIILLSAETLKLWVNLIDRIDVK